MKNLVVHCFRGFLIAAIAMLCCGDAVSAADVTNLRCEYLRDPLGIDAPKPRLSWVIQSDRRGERQTAYQVLIASTPELLAEDKGDLWDSGKVASEQQNGVEYAGAALTETTRYWWKVRVWGQDGRVFPWTEAATFETGFFSLSSWISGWIQAPVFAAHFARKEFDLAADKKVESARAYIAAIGNICNCYELRINGARVGDDLVAPGPTEPRKALYSTFDIAAMLKPGRNAVGMVYNKLWSLHIIVRYTDGTTQTLLTDNAWRGAPRGPYATIGTAGMIGSGQLEVYDARNEFIGWDKPGYNDSGWAFLATVEPRVGLSHTTPARRLPGFLTKLRARRVPCGVIETLRPKFITPKADGKYIVDFGHQVDGHVRITASGGKAGEIMNVRYAELLDEAGANLDQITIRRDAHHTYVFKDGQPVAYEPGFFNVGFRFVEVAGYPGPLTADKIDALFVASAVVNGTSFECSDATIIRLHNMARTAFLSCLLNVPTDNPGRERRGWTGDAHTVSAAQCILFDMMNLFDNWLDDHADCQDTNGWINVELPLSTDTNRDIKWPASVIIIPWNTYLAYGDKRILEDHYPTMRRYLKFLQSLAGGDCAIPDAGPWRPYLSYGDWLALEEAGSGYLGMAYYYRCADLLAKIAGVLNRRQDADEFSALAAKVKTAINASYRHDGAAVYYDNNTQSANAHALGLDVVSDADQAGVLKSLIGDYKTKGHNTTGFLGMRWVLPVLSRFGRNDVAYSYVRNPNLGGWVNWIDKWDATAIVENWCGRHENPERTGGFNQAAFGGGLAEWLYQDLPGVASVKPGYKEMRIRPFIPPDVGWARAQINTVRGWVKSAWRKQDGGFLMLDVTIPANTTATVFMPAKDAASVTEGGKPAAEAEGVKFLRMENGAAVFHVGCGSYRFQSILQDAVTQTPKGESK